MYPQLLGKSIFLNVPKVFHAIFNAVKPLLSKRTVAKMVFCPGNASASTASKACECPYIAEMLGEDIVPSFLGGKCNCPGGCIGSVPNTQTVYLNSINQEGESSMTIAAGTVQVLEIPVDKGLMIYI